MLVINLHPHLASWIRLLCNTETTLITRECKLEKAFWMRRYYDWTLLVKWANSSQKYGKMKCNLEQFHETARIVGQNHHRHSSNLPHSLKPTNFCASRPNESPTQAIYSKIALAPNPSFVEKFLYWANGTGTNNELRRTLAPTLLFTQNLSDYKLVTSQYIH